MIEFNQCNMDILAKVNFRVNKRMTYRSDKPSFDDWEMNPQAEGDCEDFARSKISILVNEYGFDARSMGRVCCWTQPNREGYHAIAVVNTTKGSFVMDNRNDSVLAWTDCGYEWNYDTVPPYLLPNNGQ